MKRGDRGKGLKKATSSVTYLVNGPILLFHLEKIRSCAPQKIAWKKYARASFFFKNYNFSQTKTEFQTQIFLTFV